MRRFTPPKRFSASIAASGSTPTWRAAAIAASAFARLWSPVRSQSDASCRLAAPEHVERPAFSLPARPAVDGVEPLDLRPAAARQHPRQRRVRAVGDDPGRAREHAHEVVELGLDRGEVREDVGVVELEVVQDRGPGRVVHELRPLVEERGVVLVRFDDEERSRRGPRRDAEVVRHAADQETRTLPVALEDPGEHRRRSGLPVGTGHRDHVLARQHVLGEPLRTGDVPLAAVEDRLHERVAPCHHVADHPEVGGEGRLVGTVAFDDLDRLRGELRAHRRIHVRVAAGYAVPGVAREQRDAAHEGAADPEDVKVHAGGL